MPKNYRAVSGVIFILMFLSTGPAYAGKLVDINTADATALRRLPGIGPVLSQRIVTNRESNGSFKDPEDIIRVYGLGRKKYEAIKDLITASRQEGRVYKAKKAPKINLNTATQVELESLPGIGPIKALRIIEYREKQGGFKRVEELVEVWGIGPRTYETLKDLITVHSGGSSDRSRSKPPPSGPRIVKCWRCGKKFAVGENRTSGTCPFCGAKWKLR
ncbi:MAG: helix-hairpin-helix domain-containing protein [Candidatus Euphemobacter frigidus]|nr:helix-hairpin-helix domain-containing protein [Candidatus Euphemobacter frigidus]MDP8276559.1 helix-hairpin-helix domain-containing protein [Candidatus Euphemobacter frigidus]